jgi:hypothetical protein
MKISTEETWSYPGSNSLAGLELGDILADQEITVDVKFNLTGDDNEHFLPLFLGREN